MTAKNRQGGKLLSAALTMTLCAGTLLAGDGTSEKGFVPPPRDRKPPPAPPRTTSGGEVWLACCGSPSVPLRRTEVKKPPTPPVLVTKIRDERIYGGGR